MTDQENKIDPTHGQLGNDSKRIALNRDERVHKIDFSKINTVEDVVVILKALDMRVTWHGDECPERFIELNNLGFLERIK